jgi:hypothetical protein
MERYLSAARSITRVAVGGADTPVTTTTYRVRPDFPQYDRLEELSFGTRGGLAVRHTFPLDADYELEIQLGSGTASGPRQLEIGVDGEVVKQFSILPPRRGRARTLPQEPEQTPDPDQEYVQGGGAPLVVRLPVAAGPRTIAVTFLEAVGAIEVEGARLIFQRPGHYHEGNQFMPAHEPFIDRVTITGPFDARGPGDTPSRRRIFTCAPPSEAGELACARTIVAALARRAFRRPVTDADVEPLFAFYRANRDNGFEAGIEMTLRRLLVAPEFLFRIEAEPAGVAPGGDYRLSGLDLASRLSFFLWSSMPDDELLELGAAGRLGDATELAGQVRRMLADPRADALAENFAGQWLYLRNLDALAPETMLFPDFDDSLRQSLRRETELFFSSIVRENRSAIELLTADYTFVNERLAAHYGIPNVYGSRFRRVRLAGENRRGLLGHGSVLFATSRPNRTSPVVRGKWILENIVGVIPPPPPPDIPALPEQSPAAARAPSVRERLAAHRSNPACASCHSMIDPLGFALEHFDAVGRWRDLDDSFETIDATGVLPDGTRFEGVSGLRQALLRDPARFVTTVTEKLLTYALGRGLEYYDAPAVRRVVREAEADDYRFASIIRGIVESVPFQMRRKTGD